MLVAPFLLVRLVLVLTIVALDFVGLLKYEADNVVVAAVTDEFCVGDEREGGDNDDGSTIES